MSNVQQLTHDLMAVGNISHRAIEKALVPTKLSPAQFQILILAAADDRITPSEIASVLHQETHSISGLLNRLEDRDLIVRHRDRQDRRVVHVALLDDGVNVLKEANRLVGPVAARLESTFRRAGVDIVNLRENLLDFDTPEHRDRRSLVVARLARLKESAAV